MVQINFNARNVQPNKALEALPSGIYPCIITSSEEKPTRDGNGAYLEFEYTVAQGHQFAGRKLYDRLNIKNKNPQTVDIAYGTLSAICHVTGRLDIQDTQQLHGAALQVVAIKTPRNDQPEVMTNQVRGYKDMHGNDPGHAGQTQQQTQQPAWGGQQQQPPQGQYQQQPPQQQQQQQWGNQVQQQPPAQDPNVQQGQQQQWGNQQPPQGQQQYQQPPQGQQQPPQNGGQQAQDPGNQETPPWAR